jgi:hypothetical protein
MCLCIVIDNGLQFDYWTGCFWYDNKLENLCLIFLKK